MFLHTGILASLGEPGNTLDDGAASLRTSRDGDLPDPEDAEDHAAVYSVCGGSLADPRTRRRYRGSFTVEASLLLIMILLILAYIMGLAGKSHEAVKSEAAQFEAEALIHEEERFVPRDLIRLCQFIEVWIPKKE